MSIPATCCLVPVAKDRQRKGIPSHMPQHPCARRLEPGPLGRCQDQALCGCGWQGRCPMRSVYSQDKSKGGDERAARISSFVPVSLDPCLWDLRWHVCTSGPCALWQWRQQAIAPEPGCTMFPGQNVTSQTQQNCCLSPATVFPSPVFCHFPEKILGALCLCPPHSSSHLACSSPLDGAKPGASVRTRGATRHLRLHPLPHTRPGLHHAPW